MHLITWCRLLCRHLARARIRPLEGNSYSGVAESLLDARDLFLCQRPELPWRQIRIQYDVADLLPMQPTTLLPRAASMRLT